ncbi:MAG: 4Fe-4S dicluster domain-containing protein [bacterium]|nr:4Fe-4S dicluster domain-containing protein [bacterium]
MPKQPEEPLKEQTRSKDKPKTRVVFGPVATDFSSANTGSWRIVRPDVDDSKCVRCLQCKIFCPTEVIEVSPPEVSSPEASPAESKEKNGTPSGKAVQIDWDYCKGCGICANVCPKNCIQMVAEDDE